MESVKERFLRYVKIDTQSQEGQPQLPSTQKQFDLARLLQNELIAMGAADVQLDAQCYVTATIPSNGCDSAPVLALIAHMDTSDAVSGKDVKPLITKSYPGGAIDMGNGYRLLPEEFPALNGLVGQELICTDGTTLLGGDDKAGIAEIMCAAERLLQKDAPKHGKIRICFTPDEEVGCGVDGLDVAAFGADYAYTVDGGAIGDINYENFNAAAAIVTFSGTSIHPGSAKGKMINAALVAMELQAMLPVHENPASTEGYEGFYHLDKLDACVDHAVAHYILRDHDRQKLAQKKALFTAACTYLNQKYGAGTAVLDLHDSYYNMKKQIPALLIDRAKAAMEAHGVTPVLTPIRGGTDGARLSFSGLPCPNLCTGGYNCHGRYEFVSVDQMNTIADILVTLMGSF